MKKRKVISVVLMIILSFIYLDNFVLQVRAAELAKVLVTTVVPEATEGDNVLDFVNSISSNMVMSSTSGVNASLVNKGCLIDGSDLAISDDVFESGHTYEYMMYIKVDDGNTISSSVQIIGGGTKNDTYTTADVLVVTFPITVNSGGGSSLPPSPEPNPEPDNHVHVFEDGIFRKPTCTMDGEGGRYCSICGYIESIYPISAFGYALYEYGMPMINSAKTGQTITFEFGVWNSFPNNFMRMIAERRDVTFVFHYEWQHQKCEITIPAGVAVDLNCDWYGPAKMNELYGTY